MVKDEVEVRQNLEQVTQEGKEWNSEHKSKKHNALTLITFAVICLATAFILYIKDYGYQEFLPGDEHNKHIEYTITK